MAPRKKTLTLDRQTFRWIQIFSIFLIISFLLRFSAIAGPVAKVIAPNDAGFAGQLMKWADFTFYLTIGLIFMSIGAKAIAFPWVGLPLVVVGAGMVIFAFWKIYAKKQPDPVSM